MDRRRFLAALGVATAVGGAGCAGVSAPAADPGARIDGGEEEAGSTPTGAPTDGAAFANPSLPVPESELNRGAAKDGIPAITEPAFASDWRGVEASLTDDTEVVGVERDGAARAYPLPILNWHEIVNDEFGGPLLVTFCPLCGSGVVAERTVDGEATVFGVSGLLWRSDLVMYDRASESLWSQLLAQAIRGPKTGRRLSLVPSTITTWGAWRAAAPDTEVLVPPPESGTIVGDATRQYGYDPYEAYARSERIGIGFNSVDDDRLHPKTTVIGVARGDVARAYPLRDVLLAEGSLVEDDVGGLPVVVAAADDGDGTLVAYDRRVDGETLSFERAGDAHLRAGGSRWRLTTGRAVDGPFEGRRLAAASRRSALFWFAWVDFHPETDVWSGD
jgi:hypothetical protein